MVRALRVSETMEAVRAPIRSTTARRRGCQRRRPGRWRAVPCRHRGHTSALQHQPSDHQSHDLPPPGQSRHLSVGAPSKNPTAPPPAMRTRPRSQKIPSRRVDVEVLHQATAGMGVSPTNHLAYRCFVRRSRMDESCLAVRGRAGDLVELGRAQDSIRLGLEEPVALESPPPHGWNCRWLPPTPVSASSSKRLHNYPHPDRGA
jgi:hypothetical protein